MLIENLNSGFVIRLGDGIRNVISLVPKDRVCHDCHRRIPQKTKCIRVENRWKIQHHICFNCFPVKELEK